MLNALPPQAASASPAAPTATAANAVGAAEPGTFARELERAAANGDGEAQAPGPAGAPQAPEARDAREARAMTRSNTLRPPLEHATARHAANDDDTDALPPQGGDEGLGNADAALTDLSALLSGLMPVPAATAPAPPPRAGVGDTRSAGDVARASGAGKSSATDVRGVGRPDSVDDATGPPGAAPDELPAAATGPRAEPLPFTLQQSAPIAPGRLATPDAPAPAAASPYAAQIAAPVGSPDFAPGLSAHLTVMVREGLHEARLQLNPAEMGPITVQIQVEGTAAQVTMAAEQAPTRQALEQAMPTLAGSLRDAGLTLTGGGVFEQAPSNAQQQQQRPDGTPARRGGGAGGEDDALAATARPAGRASSHRGVVDLYA
jgi:flagellar hook-length control protein FliK